MSKLRMFAVVSSRSEHGRLSSFLKLSFAGENIRTKPRAIASIVDRLVESGAIDHAFREEIVAAIMRREQ